MISVNCVYMDYRKSHLLDINTLACAKTEVRDSCRGIYTFPALFGINRAKRNNIYPKHCIYL